MVVVSEFYGVIMEITELWYDYLLYNFMFEEDTDNEKDDSQEDS